MPTIRSLLLLFAFAALFLTCDSLRSSRERAARAVGAVEHGTLPERWIDGTEESEPAIQVHAYNDDFWILRQSKRSDYEAPFLYLIFGEDRALLLDTGSAGEPPVRETVDDVVATWLAKRGRDAIHLVVAHTHGHGDHIANDDQFYDREDTTLVSSRRSAAQKFFGIEEWPEQIVTYDLGGRVLDVIPTPGHHNAHLAFYDRNTQLLLSGDTFYPGFLFVFSPRHWPAFRASTKRLADFARKHPVRAILGCHVEMTATPKQAYAYRTKVQPDERRLELGVAQLDELDRALDAIGDDARIEVHADFIIYPAWKAEKFGQPPPIDAEDK